MIRKRNIIDCKPYYTESNLTEEELNEKRGRYTGPKRRNILDLDDDNECQDECQDEDYTQQEEAYEANKQERGTASKMLEAHPKADGNQIATQENSQGGKKQSAREGQKEAESPIAIDENNIGVQQYSSQTSKEENSAKEKKKENLEGGEDIEIGEEEEGEKGEEEGEEGEEEEGEEEEGEVGEILDSIFDNVIQDDKIPETNIDRVIIDMRIPQNENQDSDEETEEQKKVTFNETDKIKIIQQIENIQESFDNHTMKERRSNRIQNKEKINYKKLHNTGN
jgi:hypothetical protein